MELWIDPETLPRYGENTARLLQPSGRGSGRKAADTLKTAEAQLEKLCKGSELVGTQALEWLRDNRHILRRDTAASCAELRSARKQRRLSDGRLLIAGSKCLDESKDTTRKWLLCLNPDHTVNWEYITPEEEASTIFAASERPDGTIAVLFDMGDEDHAAPEGARTKIRYFTQDGQPTGKEVNLPGCVQSNSDIGVYIAQMIVPDDENEPVRYFKTDWDGNLIEDSNTQAE